MITDIDKIFFKLNLMPTIDLNASAINKINKSEGAFPLRVSESFVARMGLADINDPLLRQILPTAAELVDVPGYEHDPLAEQKYEPIPGVLKKYNGRVLLLVTHACALNCRFCFRRHWHNKDEDFDLSQALNYLNSDKTIEEVILSGGDPLMLSNAELLAITEKLAAIAHIKRLRIHTRMPIALPERINSELINVLTATRFQPVIVVHCNHANEIDDAVIQAVNKMRNAGMLVLNQSVLLSGINDSTEVLRKLSEQLFNCGILPYYLHVLDKVSGAAHFAVEIATAKKIHQELLHTLPGYLVPKLVYEQSGAASKILVV